MTPRSLGIATALLALAATGASAQQIVVVEVREAATGRLLPEVRIEFPGMPVPGIGVALTGDDGRATFVEAPAGRWTLRASAFGYEERELPVEILPDTTTFVRVEVAAAPISLDSIAVRADRPRGAPRYLLVDVYDAATGRPVEAARVEFVDSPDLRVTLTAASGRSVFGEDQTETGRWTLRVSAFGYQDQEMEVEVLPDATTVVRVELAAAPFELEGVSATAGGFDRRLAYQGFYKRAFLDPGIFYGPEQMDEIPGGVRVTAKLKYLRGVWVSTDGSVTVGGNCTPTYYLNGLSMRGFVNLNDVVRPRDIIAVEVYDRKELIPPEFRRTGLECGAILIWTRQM
ncbi:MAG: hypothetical protein RQ745_13905 [Longimicrobiales bacterium]|nr:hypothetical protein [Longimicrobiales bacterium]